jgi:predicted TIM-barrel fold metal-dependent hydrolase
MSGRHHSAEIRSRLAHPVIDADGHIVEFEPVFLEMLQQVAGASVVNRYTTWRDQHSWFRWHSLTPEQRRDSRAVCPPWWTSPTRNAFDRATFMLPKLFHERLDELGLDFVVVYPSMALQLYRSVSRDEELRRAICRAFNRLHSEQFAPYAKRMTPAAVIPTHTPEEAIAELEYAVGTLGMKVAHVAGTIMRPIPAVARQAPEAAYQALWVDTLAIDSAYDYDPLWAKCAELKTPIISHSSGMTWGSRASISNYMYNHIGCFAAGAEAFCRALFFGGVPARFPTLRFGFLEGGVAWGCNLYADIVGHWQKRNREALQNLDPAALDQAQWLDLCRKYGDPLVLAKLAELGQPTLMRGENVRNPPDDWAACRVERAEDIRERFQRSFFFGCESDDRLVALAFDGKTNPLAARLNAVFSSDIGHWDVTDVAEVLEEAYELVDEGLLSLEQFRWYLFGNAAALYGGANPNFFKGTVVEDAVREQLSRPSPEAV